MWGAVGRRVLILGDFDTFSRTLILATAINMAS